MSELYIPPDEPRFLTPDNVPSGVFCFTIPIPDDPTWAGLVTGVLSPLMSPYAWRQFGTLTQQEAADAWRAMLYEAWGESSSCTMINTPYWDDSSDVEDSAIESEQTWYGEVTNPDAPADELDFVETAIIWVFTGLIAIATAEIGAAPAILFYTVAPKFVLAMKRGDVGEIFRIVVDGQDSASVDTSSYSAGDIVNIPIVADPAIETHSLLIIGGIAP